VISISEGRI